MSLKNDIDYKLQIFVIILLFILTNVIVFFNKQIKYFEGLIVVYGIVVVLIMSNLKIKKEDFYSTKDSDDYKKILASKFTELSRKKVENDKKIKADKDTIDRHFDEMNQKIDNYSEKILGIQFSDLLKKRLNYTYTNLDEKYCDSKEILECEKEPFCEYDYDKRKCRKIKK